MSWRYQIIFHDKDKNPWYGLHEVFVGLHPDKELDWTEDPISFVCCKDETKEGIIKSLEMALDDARKLPVLIESEHD